MRTIVRKLVRKALSAHTAEGRFIRREQDPITGIIVRIAFTVFMWMRREETGALPAMGKWSPLLSFREKTEIGVFYTAAHVAGS
jgi:hypothetical protein